MPEQQPPDASDRPSGRRIALAAAGVLLVVVGVAVANGWPFTIGGFVLLIGSTQSD